MQQGGISAAVRLFDRGGCGAVPLPKVPKFTARRCFPQPTFDAALAAPLPAEQSPSTAPDITPAHPRRVVHSLHDVPLVIVDATVTARAELCRAPVICA